MNEPEAARLADAIEASASRDFYAAAPGALGLRTEVVAGATLLLAPQIQNAYFNRVIGLGVEHPATEEDVDAVMTAYRSARTAGFWIHVLPSARPAALKDWLERRGFAPPARRSWAKFLRSPEPPAAARTDLEVRPARTTDAEAVGHIVCTAFGMPAALAPWFGALIGRAEWRVFVATAAGAPVATGSVWIRGGEAWLGIGATLPEYCRRGAQSALLAARIAAASAASCTVLATETGEAVGDEPNPSLLNIRRSGFRQVASRLNYAAPAAG